MHARQAERATAAAGLSPTARPRERKTSRNRWRRCGSDAHTPKGDVGSVDFDPVTNSQEPDVKSFAAAAEKSDPNTATIAVTITGSNAPRANAADAVIRYDFVRDAGQWKIDDIRGAEDGKPWSLRGMLSDALKN